MSRRLLSIAASALVTTSLLAACADNDDQGEAASSTSSTTEETPSTTTTTAPPEPDLGAAVEIVQTFVDEHGLNGAALVVFDIEHGIVDESYFGEFEADRVSLIASGSKMLTATVLVRLADEGLLDLDRPIAEYVDWAAGHNPEVTVAQLISNSSGLVGLVPNPAYGPYVCQFFPQIPIVECATTVWTTSDDDADVVAPDTEFRYGGAQWQIAGAVAETVSGKSWAELIDETFIHTCDVGSLGYTNHWTTFTGGGYPAEFNGDVSLLPVATNPHMEGGAYVTPTDLARIMLMHLRGGACGDSQVLTPESVARMQVDRVGEVYGGTTLREGAGYGLGWWVNRNTARVIDSGAYGMVAWLDTDNGLGAVLMLEADASLGGQLADQLYEPVETAILSVR